VRAERAVNLYTSPVRRDGPLYALRTMFITNIAGVPLGVARSAIDATLMLAEGKITRAGVGLRDEAYSQMAIARAEGLVSSARALVFGRAPWGSLTSNQEAILRRVYRRARLGIQGIDQAF